MNLSFIPILPHESDHVVQWLISDIWPYHGTPVLTLEAAKRSVSQSLSDLDQIKLFWMILPAKKEKIGLIKLFDLADPTPRFDLRIRTDYRGQGYGKQAIIWLTEYIFCSISDTIRIEGQTRQDNFAMRKLFRNCGYVKEAHYRKAWPMSNGTYFDAIGYAIIREDWEEKKITPICWDDE